MGRDSRIVRATGNAEPAGGGPQIDAEWLDAFGPADLLPPSLARWRPLVREGLLHFLVRLPAPRLAEILAGQFAIDAGASRAERLVALLRQCPTLHKLGQVIARQPYLDAELRRRLQRLESMPADVQTKPIVERLRGSLPGASALAIGDAALAQGSVAVVLPFSWREDGRVREGVFKVLRPGVQQRLADELALLPDVALLLTRRGAELDLPALDYRDILDGVRQLLTEEVRLDVEQANLREAGAFHADDPRILVPQLLPWSAPWVTAMERVHGTALADPERSPSERLRFATTAMSALLAKPFWTLDDPAVFHGDLHGGNLFAAADGRLAVLDWTLTARVSKRQREAVVAAVIGGLTLDAVQVCRAVAALGASTVDDRTLAAHVERSLDLVVTRGRIAGFDWLLGLLDEITLDGRIRFDPQLSVFRKTWMSLSGVLIDLTGDALPDTELMNAGIRAFLAEWPARWSASSSARDFATHVSNADLAAAAIAGWFTGVRYWQRAWAQLGRSDEHSKIPDAR
jgi:ubiquinone biosynthesis protein